MGNHGHLLLKEAGGSPSR